MPRWKKTNTLQCASTLSYLSEVSETGNSALLPHSAEACTRELEQLAARQRAVMSRMKEVSTSLNQMLWSQTDHSEAHTEEVVVDKSTAPVLDRGTSNVQINDTESEKNESPKDEMPPPAVYQANDFPANESYPDINCDQSSPLISALKKLQHSRGQKRGVKMWSHNLARLFSISDVDGSRYIDPCEYKDMINTLDLSESLKDILRNTFRKIDIDGSNDINLREFLLYFLKFPMFKQELLITANNNAPYNYENTLTRMQRWRQWLYCIVECPGYNFLSRLLFCIDLVLTLIPIGILWCEGVSPSINVKSFKQQIMWIVSVFFALEYICGLMTCKYKGQYIFNIVHTFELISFFFWIIYYTFAQEWTLDPIGFVVFRVIRFINIRQVFKIDRLQEDIDIYVNTLKLAYASSGAVIMLLLYTIILFALLVNAFERGSWNPTEKRWERDASEGESPFADISTCIYFTVVTMTTLGYGDISPKSFVGRFVAIITVFVGLCNITFLINIVGDCFEEVFRGFVLRRSNKIEEEHSKHLMECAEHFEKKKDCCWNFLNRKRQRHLRMLHYANNEINKRDYM